MPNVDTSATVPPARGILATLRDDGPLQSPSAALLEDLRKLRVLTSELAELDDEVTVDD